MNRIISSESITARSEDGALRSAVSTVKWLMHLPSRMVSHSRMESEKLAGVRSSCPSSSNVVCQSSLYSVPGTAKNGLLSSSRMVS